MLTAADRVEAALALLDARGGEEAERGWLCTYLAYWCRFDDPRRALGYAERAVALAAASDDRASAAWSLYMLGMLRCHNGHQRDGLLAMAAGAAAREALDPEEQARLTARLALGGEPINSYHGWNSLAHRLAYAGRFAEAGPLAERLLALPPAPQEAGRVYLCVALGGAAANFGRPAESARWYAEAQICARTEGSPWLAGEYALNDLLTLHLPYRADYPDERERLVTAAAAAASMERFGGVTRVEMAVRLARLPLQVLAGEWYAAREVALAARVVGGVNVPKVCSLLGPLALARGEADLARQLVRETLPDGPDTEPGDSFFCAAVILQRVAAHLALNAGNLALAQEWLNAHDRWLAWSGAVPGRSEGQLGWAAYHRATGDRDAAHQHATQALADATEPRQPLALLAAHRLLGELDTDAGRFDDATTHLAASLALADACAAPYERALTLLAMAELHAATGKRDVAHALVTEVRTLCTPLGAKPALARADALAVRLDPAAVDAPGSPVGMTRREEEVLRCVAAGMSNREIAAALSVSVRTVERHIENLYRKIDARNKAEAVAYAFRHNLV